MRLRAISLLIETCPLSDIQKGTGWQQTLSFPEQAERAERPRSTAFSVENGRHAPACVCCVARPALAMTLLERFQARARGICPFFQRVVLVVPRDQVAQTGEALKTDPLLQDLLTVEATA